MTLEIEEDMLNTFTKPAFCRLNAGETEYFSQASFSRGALVYLFNNNMDRRLRRYADYKLRTLAEIGFTKHVMLKTSRALGHFCWSQFTELQVLKCEAFFQEQKISAFRALPKANLEKEAWMMLVGLMVSSRLAGRAV